MKQSKSSPVPVALGLILAFAILYQAGWSPVLPPLIAISLAIWTKRVLPSLFSGLFAGALLVNHGNVVTAFMRVSDDYLVKPVLSPDKAPILIFSMVIAGMVGVISRSAGTQGILEVMVRWAKGPRSAQIATQLMGLFIFFDDYANTLLVGNTMRSLTDKLKVSREKLAYIVDSTAAPVASVAVISTWVGFEVGLIGDAFKSVGYEAHSGYSAFLASIPYSFYSIYSLLFVAFVALMARDFGPMLRAEERARSTGNVVGDDAKPMGLEAKEELMPRKGVPPRWINAVAPVGMLVILVFVGLFSTGREGIALEEYRKSRKELRLQLAKAFLPTTLPAVLAEREKKLESRLAEAEPRLRRAAHVIAAEAPMRRIMGKADPMNTLLWASFFGSFLAIFLPFVQGICSLGELFDAWIEGSKSLVMALMILVLAWGLNGVCNDLGTGPFIAELVHKVLAPWALPFTVFLTAALVAFSTGTSWATMSILMGLSVTVAHGLATQAGMSAAGLEHLLLATIGSVLAGACFGDHCSPISDTTIMSSMASGCDHIDHVRTQMPYALVCAAVAGILGYLPAGMGLSPWFCLPLGTLALLAILRFAGSSTQETRDHFDTYLGPGLSEPIERLRKNKEKA